MNFIEFNKFKENIDNLNINEKENLKELVNQINIDDSNFNNWVENIFSENINQLDMNKMPYVIDELYQSNDKYKFMICCMLLESTVEKLPFVTNLENYPLFKEKYDVLKNTLITIYENFNNGIAICMGLILLNYDPKFELFESKEKEAFVKASQNKLELLLKYIKSHDIVDQQVYNDLEIIIDLCCYLRNEQIDNLVIELDNLTLNYDCNIFILKYKAINNLDINNKKLEELLNNEEFIEKVFRIMENINKLNILPLDKITQEMIAKSSMIEWLKYPTELGKVPDEISLLGEFEFNSQICYAYKFKSNSFRTKEYMLGIVGGYEPNKTTARNSGLTFSAFEIVDNDYMKQANKLAQFMFDLWEKRKK